MVREYFFSRTRLIYYLCEPPARERKGGEGAGRGAGGYNLTPTYGADFDGFTPPLGGTGSMLSLTGKRDRSARASPAPDTDSSVDVY